MKVIDLTAKILRQLETARVSSARLDSELIVAHAAGQDRVWLLAHGEDEVSAKTFEQAQALAKKRAERQPLSYVLSQREFYGLKFFVDRRVLTPRTETEVIVAEAIRSTPKSGRVLDIGTGSGALAISLAKHRPDLTIVASDISRTALTVARKNAEVILGNNHNITFAHSDLFTKIPGRFDVAMANLPYVASTNKAALLPEVAHEPAVALFGGSDGLELYRRFFKSVSGHINSKALVYTESDPWQHRSLTELALEAGLRVYLTEYFILGFSKS